MTNHVHNELPVCNIYKVFALFLKISSVLLLKRLNHFIIICIITPTFKQMLLKSLNIREYY